MSISGSIGSNAAPLAGANWASLWSKPGRAARQASFLERRLRAQVLARLAHLEQGLLVLEEPGATHRFQGALADEALVVHVRVHDPALWVDLALGGTVGAGEAYMKGYWDADDLPALVRLFVRNRAMMQDFEGGLARLAAPMLRLLHGLHRNTRRGSRRNIAAHYDLGNDFYGLFLDSSSMYSAAWYERADMTLEEASRAKLDLALRALELKPGEHLLEIGTGWGALAIHAAQHYGVRVTTTTISRAQYEGARQRVREAGLEQRVQVLLQDYRDLEGSFDKLVSIEMIEAVGLGYIDHWFEVAAARLKPGGRMLVQAITIDEQLFEQARRSVDFIQCYIFPGSAIPSRSWLERAAQRTGAFELRSVHDLTLDYARTLAAWRERFLARLEEARALRYPDEFLRRWDFYLAYCEGGFRERSIGDLQLVFERH